jgi:hypothetical protein
MPEPDSKLHHFVTTALRNLLCRHLIENQSAIEAHKNFSLLMQFNDEILMSTSSLKKFPASVDTQHVLKMFGRPIIKERRQSVKWFAEL